MTQDVKALSDRVQAMENNMEEFLFTFLSDRMIKRDALEMLEDAIVMHFGVNKADFKLMSFKRNGVASRALARKNPEIIEARKWLVILARYVLLKTCGTLKLEYDWYIVRNEWGYRKIFIAALDPISPEDHEHREVFLAICSIIKRDIKELYESSQLYLLLS
jgi:hypothetical protein